LIRPRLGRLLGIPLASRNTEVSTRKGGHGPKTQRRFNKEKERENQVQNFETHIPPGGGFTPKEKKWRAGGYLTSRGGKEKHRWGGDTTQGLWGVPLASQALQISWKKMPERSRREKKAA